MGWIKNIFEGNKHDRSNEKPKYIRNQTDGDATYEIYKCSNAETAKSFLMDKHVDKKKYYIVVETPDGNWGMDSLGLYLESLLPFQKRLDEAQYTVTVTGAPEENSLILAAQGVNDNFLIKVQCAKCGIKWIDGVRYKKKTVVKCPECKSLNLIDTNNISLEII